MAASMEQAAKDYADFKEKVKRTIYIDQLSPQVTSQVIKAALTQCANVVNVEFIVNYTIPYDIPSAALVELDDEMQAKAAVELMNDFPFMILGMPRPVKATPAKPEMFQDRPPRPGINKHFRWVKPGDDDYEPMKKLKILAKRQETENMALIKIQLEEEKELAKQQQEVLDGNCKKYDILETVMRNGATLTSLVPSTCARLQMPLRRASTFPLLLLLLSFSASLFFSSIPVATAVGGCPLDFSWANFTLASAACSDPTQRAACCRYINAFVAISIARYANATGRLGIPPAFAEMCLRSVSDTFNLRGIPTDAGVFCGLGPKIRVSYQCAGRDTVLEMMQSPNFNDVIGSCRGPLSLDITCKTCLNYGIVYLHRLIGSDDNVGLSVCRNAVFVTLATQEGILSNEDIVKCFFGVQGITTFAGPSSVTSTPASSPNVTVDSPAPRITAVPQKHQQHYRITVVPGIGIGVILLAVLLQLILVALIRRKSRELKNADFDTQNPENTFHQSQSWRCPEGQSTMFQRYSYKETLKATDNFSTVIGKGGFGTVYKAQFSDGSLAAVKRMDKVSRQAEEEFCREMELLARLHHRHLVTLKGFCIERKERFLVYEYMAHGSLKDHLHSSGRKALSWQTRLQIAMDVANALEYLHFFCNPPLCHRDIKSSNILLDEHFVAKLADFGLAHASRTGTISFEAVNTDIRGTPGYMDPEYVVTQELTEKSDIYSYGVLLLELVTGRRAIQDNKNLVEWAQIYLSSGVISPEMVDPRVRDVVDIDQLHLVIGIVQWCIQKEGKQRPSIRQVLRMLSERLDPGNGSFGEGMEDAEGGFYPRSSKCGVHRNELIPHSGDMRSLHSSSSTTRSYCSRSMLLESGQAQSPPETL